MNGIQFKSSHDLDFEIAPWEPIPGFPIAGEFQRFRVGTCDGLWSCSKDHYNILAVTNNEIGNGHFDDVLEWFENSCKRDSKDLVILEVWNKKLRKHLLKKRGFVAFKSDDVIKKIKTP